MQTLQDIINQRKFLTEEQQLSLISLLTFKTREAIRKEITAKVRYSFYTCFDSKGFANRICFENGIAEYYSLNNRVEELARIRINIIES
jgi:hypothetical protein